MRRLVCILPFLMMFLPFYAEENATQSTVKWSLDDQGVLTIKGECPIADCLSSGSPWAYFKENIKEVIIEEGVTGIGAGAFSGCRNLTSVSIPNSVTFIGEEAFGNCSQLKNIVVPEKVTSIGSEAFYKCNSLTQAVLPKNLQEIPNGLFRKCSNLKTFTIPLSVTSIGNYAFEGCGMIDSLSIPKKVMSIGDGAFKGCNGIIEITIPEGVTVIGKETFCKCAFLEKVTISSTVKQIGRNAFNQCPRLVDVYINASSVPQVEGNPFGKNNKKMYLWTSSNRKRNYMYDKYWGQFIVCVKNEEEQNVTKGNEGVAEKGSHIVKEQKTSTVATTTDNKGTYYEVISSSHLNVRSAANTKATIIGFLNNGDKVKVYEIVGSWGKISYNSKIGYVYMSYLKQTLTAPEKSSSPATQSTSAVTSSSLSSKSTYLDVLANNSSSNNSSSNSSINSSTNTSTKTSINTSTKTSTNTSTKSSTNTQQTISSVPEKGCSLGMFLDVTGDVGKLKILGETAGGIGGDFTVGFYTPEQYNFLGASLGLQSIFCNPNKNTKFTYLVMPIFVNDKLYFTNNEYRPYLDLSIGGFVNLMSKYNGAKQKVEGGGFFFRSGLGVDMKGVNITVGYELMYGKNKNDAMHMVFFKLGIGGVYK